MNRRRFLEGLGATGVGMALGSCAAPSEVSQSVTHQPAVAHRENTHGATAKEGIEQALSQYGEDISVREESKEQTIVVDNRSRIPVVTAPFPDAPTTSYLEPGSRVRSYKRIQVGITSTYQGQPDFRFDIEAYEVQNGYVIKYYSRSKGLSAHTVTNFFQVIDLEHSLQGEVPRAMDHQPAVIPKAEQPPHHPPGAPTEPLAQEQALESHQPPADIPRQESYMSIEEITKQIGPFVEHHGYKYDHANSTSGDFKNRRLLVDPIPESGTFGYVYRQPFGHIYLRRKSDDKLVVIGIITKATTDLNPQQAEALNNSQWSVAFVLYE